MSESRTAEAAPVVARSDRINEDVAQARFTSAMATYSQTFSTFFLAKLMGLQISFPGETCVVEMEVHDFLFNPQGSLHGGIIATMADMSMGHLLEHTSGPGVTLEMKVQYLRAIRSGRLRSEGRFLKRGRSINYLQAEMVDSDGKTVAVATSTWQLLERAKPTPAS
jgi:acyl-CoA thioesterase